MFGPLNGVRVALVAAAAIAAVVALGAGFTLAGLVLLVGIAVHGLGWLYLYRQGDESRSGPRAPHSPV
jgi:4-hydroxybenzoate polyprenyltransferase